MLDLNLQTYAIKLTFMYRWVLFIKLYFAIVKRKLLFREYIWLQFHISAVETKPHDVKSGSKLSKV